MMDSSYVHITVIQIENTALSAGNKINLIYELFNTPKVQ